jgi:hypothetical protein
MHDRSSGEVKLMRNQMLRSDLVARRLQLSGFKFVRLMGSMTPLARDNTIKAFTDDPECTVFLISLKAGGGESKSVFP